MIWFLLALAVLLLVILLPIGVIVDGGDGNRRRKPSPDPRLPGNSEWGPPGAEAHSPVHRLIDRTLACIRDVESGHRYSAVSPDARYFGAYQFDFSTWGSVGGRGDPSAAPPAEQDYRAALLLMRRGLQPWPSAGGCAA